MRRRRTTRRSTASAGAGDATPSFTRAVDGRAPRRHGGRPRCRRCRGRRRRRASARAASLAERGATDAGPAHDVRARRPRPAARGSLGGGGVGRADRGRRRGADRKSACVDRTHARRVERGRAELFERRREGLAVDDSERFGFRLRAGAVELQLGAGNWQAINDPATLVVTTFRVEPRVDEISLASFCAAPCAAGSTVCPPSQQVRSFAVTISGRSAMDAALTRASHTSVRARNDAVRGSCEG